MDKAVHRRSLPHGWYPATADGIDRFITSTEWQPGIRGMAAIVPHAGWKFSGLLAAKGIASLYECETIVLVGGHLRSDAGLQILPYTHFETPVGMLQGDQELTDYLEQQFHPEMNGAVDNSTEVQLPLLAWYHSKSRVVVMRASPSAVAGELGVRLAEYSRAADKRIAVVGSTDLTHYGPDYGFTPHGSAPEAINWVRDTNDRYFVDAALNLDGQGMLEAAEVRRAACSAGAAVVAASFAAARDSSGGRLLGYSTSYDIYPGESFVGYASIIYPFTS